MANFAGLAGIAIERAQLTRSIILRMIGLAEVRDPTETGPHVNRVAEVAMRSTTGGPRPTVWSRTWRRGSETTSAWRPCSTTWARWPCRTRSSGSRVR